MRGFYVLFVLLYCITCTAHLVSAESNDTSVWVYTDAELFAALCAQESLIWIGADLDLREERWPKDCQAPVQYAHNLTISGPLNENMRYQVSFNFMARKVVIPPYGEVRLRHFTARNTRRGGGGEIDFIAYSPKGILWTDDLNKNQIICMHTEPSAFLGLPMPVGFPQFANKTQMIEMWDSYCTDGVYGRCWTEVLHYTEFYTDVNVGSDANTGGYVMAKANASKTCDSFLATNSTCILTRGADACMQDVITAFLAALPPIGGAAEPSGASGVNKLAVTLPVALGGAAVIAAAVVLVLVVRRRWLRRRAAEAVASAAALKLVTPGDMEEGGGGRGAGVRRDRELVYGSKGAASSTSGSKEGSSSEDLPPYGHDMGHGTKDSFGYETNGDMGRCLSANRGAGSARSVGVALLEGVMDDGSVCTVTVGSPLGQGSYGVVFKGTWRDKPVAVKLILCDKASSEQVAVEVRLMTSEACRHPNLLRAYSCMTRTRLVNKHNPASQALQSTIASLTSSARNRSGGAPAASAVMAAAVAAAGSGKSVASDAAELVETWIVSEYCDLGALAPHVHFGKKFMLPPTAAANEQRQRHLPYDLYGSNHSNGVNSGLASSSSGQRDGEGSGQGNGQQQQPPQQQPQLQTQLQQQVAGRRPCMSAILSCLRDIAAGMAHLHSLNIVHGDLKLANVLLCTGPAGPGSREGAAPGAGEGTAAPAASQAPSEPTPNPPTTTTTTTTTATATTTTATTTTATATTTTAATTTATTATTTTAATITATTTTATAATAGVAEVSPPLSTSLVAQLPAGMVAKVADFGLSRWLKEGQTHHSTKTVGTVTHMPPELLRSGKLTLSGDVYSFGIIMWELVTGSVPYRGLLYGEVVERVVVSHRRPEFPPHTPAAYRSLAERCWAADAAARPPFPAVLSELESLLAAAPGLQAESDAVALPPRQPSGANSND